MRPFRASVSVLGAALLGALTLGGCPGATDVEYIQGGVDTGVSVGGPGSVEVLTPGSNLLITGGTQVEVNWRATVPSRFSVFNVIVDPDRTDPNSGNEIFAFRSLPLTTSSVLVDTTRLQRGTYNFAVVIQELDSIAAYAYAAGQVTIDQRPTLFFDTPRQSVQYDRSPWVNPTIDVAWTLQDPDSTNTVDVYLDPDDSPNGNEVLLYKSTSATGDRFSFDLPTAQFAPGEYRILASVADPAAGTRTAIYAPATIRILARLAGPVDLRTIDNPDSQVRGAVFEGFNPRDNAGSFVAQVPDIDGDGFDEILLVSQFGKPRFQTNEQRTGVGEAYMIYGRADRFSGQINLNSVGSLVRGEIYPGVQEVTDPIRPSRGITSFAVLSDWDNDGTRDFAFGVPFTDSLSISSLETEGYFRTGAVVLASSQSIAGFGGGRVLNIGDFGVRVGPDGFTVPQCPHTFYGPKAPAFGAGGTQFYRYLTIGITNIEWLGARISTAQFGDQCGENIAAYRCANFTDSCGLIIAVPNRNPNVCISAAPDLPGAGVVSVYFRPGGFNPWNLEDPSLPYEGPFTYILDDRNIGFDARGLPRPLSPGYVSYDNGNQCPDITSPATPGPNRTARFYGGFSGARVAEVAQGGDVNADGVQDILIGSTVSGDGNGSVLVVFGRLEELVLQTGIGAELDLEELGRPMDTLVPTQVRVYDGLRILGGPGERLGQSIADGGDFNGDGLSDIVLGSPLSGNRAGGAAIFYGSRDVVNLTEREIPYAELPQRGLGVLFTGETDGDLAGMRIASVGDVDRDSFDDILIAAPNASVFTDVNADGIVDVDRSACGVVYLVYGGPDFERRSTPGGQPGVLNLKYCGTEYLPGAVFIGRNSGDYLGATIGEQGDRSRGISVAGDVDGDGQSDFLLSSVVASPRNRAQAGEIYLIYGVGE